MCEQPTDKDSKEKMLRLNEELCKVEDDRNAGDAGVTLEELDVYLTRVIEEL